MLLRFNDYFNYHAALIDGNACNGSLTVFKISHDIHYTITFRRLGLPPTARGLSTTKEIIWDF
jgi:hypothetical protein